MTGKLPEDEEIENEGPGGEEPDNEEDEPEAEALSGDALTAHLFRSAVRSLRDVIPTWKTQAELLLGHPVEFVADFDSLEGRYDYVQPFVHQAIVGALEALAKVRFDPNFGHGLASVNHIEVRPMVSTRQKCTVDLSGSMLTIRVPLDVSLKAERAPTDEIVEAMRAAIGSNSPARSQWEDPFSPPEDCYQRAQRAMENLEQAMHEAKLWPGDKPTGAVQVKGPFGSDNMLFTQWLAWVFIPRVREIVGERGKFPGASSVGLYAATHGFNGIAHTEKIIQILTTFDRFLADVS